MDKDVPFRKQCPPKLSLPPFSSLTPTVKGSYVGSSASRLDTAGPFNPFMHGSSSHYQHQPQPPGATNSYSSYFGSNPQAAYVSQGSHIYKQQQAQTSVGLTQLQLDMSPQLPNLDIQSHGLPLLASQQDFVNSSHPPVTMSSCDSGLSFPSSTDHLPQIPLSQIESLLSAAEQKSHGDVSQEDGDSDSVWENLYNQQCTQSTGQIISFSNLPTIYPNTPISVTESLNNTTERSSMKPIDSGSFMNKFYMPVKNSEKSFMASTSQMSLSFEQHQPTMKYLPTSFFDSRTGRYRDSNFHSPSHFERTHLGSDQFSDTFDMNRLHNAGHDIMHGPSWRPAAYVSHEENGNSATGTQNSVKKQRKKKKILGNESLTGEKIKYRGKKSKNIDKLTAPSLSNEKDKDSASAGSSLSPQFLASLSSKRADTVITSTSPPSVLKATICKHNVPESLCAKNMYNIATTNQVPSCSASNAAISGNLHLTLPISTLNQNAQKTRSPFSPTPTSATEYSPGCLEMESVDDKTLLKGNGNAASDPLLNNMYKQRKNPTLSQFYHEDLATQSSEGVKNLCPSELSSQTLDSSGTLISYANKCQDSERQCISNSAPSLKIDCKYKPQSKLPSPNPNSPGFLASLSAKRTSLPSKLEPSPKSGTQKREKSSNFESFQARHAMSPEESVGYSPSPITCASPPCYSQGSEFLYPTPPMEEDENKLHSPTLNFSPKFLASVNCKTTTSDLSHSLTPTPEDLSLALPTPPNSAGPKLPPGFNMSLSREDQTCRILDIIAREKEKVTNSGVAPAQQPKKMRKKKAKDVSSQGNCRHMLSMQVKELKASNVPYTSERRTDGTVVGQNVHRQSKYPVLKEEPNLAERKMSPYIYLSKHDQTYLQQEEEKQDASTKAAYVKNSNIRPHTLTQSSHINSLISNTQISVKSQKSCNNLESFESAKSSTTTPKADKAAAEFQSQGKAFNLSQQNYILNASPNTSGNYLLSHDEGVKRDPYIFDDLDQNDSNNFWTKKSNSVELLNRNPKMSKIGCCPNTPNNSNCGQIPLNKMKKEPCNEVCNQPWNNHHQMNMRAEVAKVLTPQPKQFKMDCEMPEFENSVKTKQPPSSNPELHQFHSEWEGIWQGQGHTNNGNYLSTDFVYSHDAQQHSHRKSIITHNVHQQIPGVEREGTSDRAIARKKFQNMNHEADVKNHSDATILANSDYTPCRKLQDSKYVSNGKQAEVRLKKKRGRPPKYLSTFNKSTLKPDVGKPAGKKPKLESSSKVQYKINGTEVHPENLKLNPNLVDRLANNLMEVADCSCLGSNDTQTEAAEGPYYTQLGAARDIPGVRKIMEQRTGAKNDAIRIEKVIFTGKEGKSREGCPVAKWIIRRSGPEEKYLCIVRKRPGHFCNTAVIIVVIVAWEGVLSQQADSLYDFLITTLPKNGLETDRRCGLNEKKTCACQGVDLLRRGASFSFGCSWSMYYNGCKFARSQMARKFKLKESAYEVDLGEHLQSLATDIAPLYHQLAPDAFRNQTQFESLAQDCRLGRSPGRPFSGVTAVVDFCCHSHRDGHNMNNGSTVVVNLTKHRGFEKPDDEQFHVLPLYILDQTDEFGSMEGQTEKVRNGSLEVLSRYMTHVRMRSTPYRPGKRNRTTPKKESQKKNSKKLKLSKAKSFQPENLHDEILSGSCESTSTEGNYILSQSPSADIPSGSNEGGQNKAAPGVGLEDTDQDNMSYSDLMAQQEIPGFKDLYTKFWDYFYTHGEFPPRKWTGKKKITPSHLTMNNGYIMNESIPHQMDRQPIDVTQANGADQIFFSQYQNQWHHQESRQQQQQELNTCINVINPQHHQRQQPSFQSFSGQHKVNNQHLPDSPYPLMSPRHQHHQSQNHQWSLVPQSSTHTSPTTPQTLSSPTPHLSSATPQMKNSIPLLDQQFPPSVSTSIPDQAPKGSHMKRNQLQSSTNVDQYQNIKQYMSVNQSQNANQDWERNKQKAPEQTHNTPQCAFSESPSINNNTSDLQNRFSNSHPGFDITEQNRRYSKPNQVPYSSVQLQIRPPPSYQEVVEQHNKQKVLQDNENCFQNQEQSHPYTLSFAQSAHLNQTQDNKFADDTTSVRDDPEIPYGQSATAQILEGSPCAQVFSLSGTHKLSSRPSSACSSGMNQDMIRRGTGPNEFPNLDNEIQRPGSNKSEILNFSLEDNYLGKVQSGRCCLKLSEPAVGARLEMVRHSSCSSEPSQSNSFKRENILVEEILTRKHSFQQWDKPAGHPYQRRFSLSENIVHVSDPAQSAPYNRSGCANEREPITEGRSIDCKENIIAIKSELNGRESCYSDTGIGKGQMKLLGDDGKHLKQQPVSINSAHDMAFCNIAHQDFQTNLAPRITSTCKDQPSDTCSNLNQGIASVNALSTSEGNVYSTGPLPGEKMKVHKSEGFVVPKLGQGPSEPPYQVIDSSVISVETDDNHEVFEDPAMGGVAIALCHGAVLFEVAKRELHATTALKEPNRYQPKRISLVFYQHKNLNLARHGFEEYERKTEERRNQAEQAKLIEEMEAKGFFKGELGELASFPNLTKGTFGKVFNFPESKKTLFPLRFPRYLDCSPQEQVTPVLFACMSIAFPKYMKEAFPNPVMLPRLMNGWMPARISSSLSDKRRGQSQQGSVMQAKELSFLVENFKECGGSNSELHCAWNPNLPQGTSSSTNSIITRWVHEDTIVTGPYNRWVELPMEAEEAEEKESLQAKSMSPADVIKTLSENPPESDAENLIKGVISNLKTKTEIEHREPDNSSSERITLGIPSCISKSRNLPGVLVRSGRDITSEASSNDFEMTGTFQTGDNHRKDLMKEEHFCSFSEKSPGIYHSSKPVAENTELRETQAGATSDSCAEIRLFSEEPKGLSGEKGTDRHVKGPFLNNGEITEKFASALLENKAKTKSATVFPDEGSTTSPTPNLKQNLASLPYKAEAESCLTRQASYPQGNHISQLTHNGLTVVPLKNQSPVPKLNESSIISLVDCSSTPRQNHKHSHDNSNPHAEQSRPCQSVYDFLMNRCNPSCLSRKEIVTHTNHVIQSGVNFSQPDIQDNLSELSADSLEVQRGEGYGKKLHMES